MSVNDFLDSVSNRHTKKEYRYGIKKFCDWYEKLPEEILEMRKDDLTPRPNENIIEAKHRAKRFEREIEKFHTHLIEQKYSINTARTSTLGIRQLFRYYEMPIRFRTGSRVTKTVKTNKSFPLMIEHIRAMFNVADLKERVLLSLATDLGLRISDFRNIKRSDLPDLSQDTPIPFEVMTGKEDIIAYGFLSSETVELLKVYFKTIVDRENPYLFPSNVKKPISDDRINSWLKKLAKKSGVNTNGKSLTIHCFRKMFLCASIDSGIGLTAGKKMCGKAIPQSDDTYFTTVKLREKFIQLKKILTIRQTPQSDTKEQIIQFEAAIVQLQKENLTRKTTADVMTKRVAQLESKLEEAFKTNERLEPLTEFMDSFKSREEMQSFLDSFRSASVIRFPEHKLRLVLDKLDTKEDKWVMISEVFQDAWEKMSQQTLDRVLKQLEEKDNR